MCLAATCSAVRVRLVGPALACVQRRASTPSSTSLHPPLRLERLLRPSLRPRTLERPISSTTRPGRRVGTVRFDVGRGRVRVDWGWKDSDWGYGGQEGGGGGGDKLIQSNPRRVRWYLDRGLHHLHRVLARLDHPFARRQAWILRNWSCCKSGQQVFVLGLEGEGGLDGAFGIRLEDGEADVQWTSRVVGLGSWSIGHR